MVLSKKGFESTHVIPAAFGFRRRKTGIEPRLGYFSKREA
jgi:hypothetical protein